jgi:hypothetical protein
VAQNHPMTIMDTYPAFQEFWMKAHHWPVSEQIEGWASTYMAQWPELLEKQIKCYAEDDLDWRQIARERVFPALGERLRAMELARLNLLDVCAPAYAAARERLGFESDVIFVLYVGVGCGAGWATTYRQTPAVLLGLENIAEEGWLSSDALSGMLAHEIGHLAHFHWRAQRGLPKGAGPWWDLYEEGFAQRCEHVTLGAETWHMARGSGYAADWLDWCRENLSWLAAEYLRRVDAGEDVRPFFGSWFEIQGRKQCGYFLGHELVKRLEASMSLQEIAVLEDIERQVRLHLEEMARLER